MEGGQGDVVTLYIIPGSDILYFPRLSVSKETSNILFCFSIGLKKKIENAKINQNPGEPQVK